MAKKKIAKKTRSKKKSPAKKKTSKRPGLWENIHRKHARIEAGSGEKMRKKGDPGAPTDRSILKSQAKSRSKKA